MKIENQQEKNKSIENESPSLKDKMLQIKEWCLYIKSNWLIVVFVGILGGSLGIGFAMLSKPDYVATLSFALEDDKAAGVGGLSGALGLASSLGIDLGTSAGGAFSGSNLMELMKSRTLIERALLSPIIVSGKSITLAEDYLDFSGLRDELKRKKRLSDIHFLGGENRSIFSLQKDSILGEIYRKVIGDNTDALLNVAQKDKKISIIYVEVKSKDELFSKELTENIVKEVSTYYVDAKSKKARNNVAILQKQADSIRNELNEAISGVAQATDNTFNLNLALNVKRTPSAHRQVDVQANTAILTQLVANLEMAKVTLLKETPLIQVIDKPILPLKKIEWSKLKSLILSGILASILAILFLIIKRSFKKIMN